MTLTDDLNEFIFTQSDTAKVKASMNDTTIAFNNCEIIDNKVIVELTENMLIKSGKLKIEVVIYNTNGSKLTSATCVIAIAESISEADVEQSQEFSALTNALTQVQSLEQRLDNVISSATTDTEIIDARDSEVTLNARLDKIETGERMSTDVKSRLAMPVFVRTDTSLISVADTLLEQGIYDDSITKESLITLTTNDSNATPKQQLYIAGDSVKFRTYSSGAWGDWITLADNNDVLDCMDGVIENTADILSLEERVNDAFDDVKAEFYNTIYNTISAFAFYKNSNITEFDVQDDIVAIGNSAFKDCTALTSLTLPNTLKYVCDNAFEGCTALENVTLASDFNCSINLSHSNNISVNSLNSIVDSLANRVGQSKLTLNLGSINISKLSVMKKLIVQQKNWVLI